MLILLADDERMVRLGLQSMLEELFEHENTYIYAKNGREVVDLLQNQQPDIAFLDIKMPLMNGLEALKICSESSPTTIWIILTGYADFDYARQALSLSAFDYILKPIDIQALGALFERIAAKKAVNHTQSNTIFAHDVIRSFNMADQFPAEEVRFMPDTVSNYVLYEFYIDKHTQSIQHHIKQSLGTSLNTFCTQNALIQNHCQFFNTDGNLCFVCDTPDTSRLTHYIALQSGKLPGGSFSVFYGSGKTIKDIYDISKRISQIKNVRIIRNCSQPELVHNIEVLPQLSGLLTFAANLSDLLDLYIRQNTGSFRQQLYAFSQSKDSQSLFASVHTAVLSNYLHNFFDKRFSFTSFDELIKELNQCTNYTGRQSITLNNTDISKIQDFIYQNYGKDVSISYVSELFNLSPTYLSKLFHEKTGQKYIDFVTKLRMEKARQLILENPSISVKQVSEEVGYTSMRHFSKIFQRYTGSLPSSFGKV